MRNLRRKSAGGPVDGITASRRRASRVIRPLALAFLALATTTLVGCTSGPCGGGPCGGGGSGILSGMKSGVRSMTDTVRNTTARVFHHKSGGCSTCGDGGVVEGVPIEGSVIQGGVMPGPVVAPPASESAPTILDPVPPTGSTAPKTKSSGVQSGSLKDLGNRQSAAFRGRSIESNCVGRGQDLARADSTPSAGSSAEGISSSRGGASSNPLDHIPPLDLADEVARRGQSSSVPVEAELVKPLTSTSSNATKTPTASLSPPVPQAADEVELPPIRAGMRTASSAGIKRFASLKPNINGGSAPAGEGLTWLKERGVKTLVDLRESNEVDSKFVDTVKTNGFRYVSLPLNPGKLDQPTIARFGEEINKSENLPVYFFDNDGNRAGVAWYLHRLTADKVDAQIASREAEELGLTDKSNWVAAAKYIDTAKSAEAAAKAKAKPAEAKPAATAATAPLPSLEPLPAPASAKAPAPITSEPSPSAAKPKPATSAWRSSAALIMTGMSGPVVHWSNAMVSASKEASANRPATAR